MHLDFSDGLMPWWILMVTGWFFIMMSWISWIHGLVGVVKDWFLVWFVSSCFGDLGFTWY